MGNMKFESLKAFQDQMYGCSHSENLVDGSSDRYDREAMGPSLLVIVVFPGKVSMSRSMRLCGLLQRRSRRFSVLGGCDLSTFVRRAMSH